MVDDRTLLLASALARSGPAECPGWSWLHGLVLLLLVALAFALGLAADLWLSDFRPPRPPKPPGPAARLQGYKLS